MIRRVNPDRRLETLAPCSELRPGPMQRIAHTSDDCGKTWSEPFLLAISGVCCHGTLAHVGNRLLFSIPNGAGESERSFVSDRKRGAVYFSSDEGKTWCYKIIEPESFSYSTIGRLNESQYVTLFARNTMGQDGVGCRVFDDEWLDLEDGILPP